MPNNMIDPRGSGPAPKPKPAAKAKAAPKASSGGGGGGGYSSTIAAVQRKLGIKVDGINGPQTRAAVIAYQRKHGLTPDGIAGPKTLGKMGLSGGSGGGGGGSSKSSGSKAKATSSKGPKLDYSQLAQQYGWSMAMINSDPSLKKLFEAAVKGSYTADKFVAELRNTSWFKKNSETARQMAVLKTTDPSTYKQRQTQIRAAIASQAGDLGAQVSSGNLAKIADQALTLGWNDDQIRNTLSGYIKFASNGTLSGLAAQVEDDLRGYARNMGVRISDNFIVGAAKKVANKQSSIEQQRDILAKTAISAFPHLADRIKAGETLAEIAAPYQQTMAQILELNPEQIDVFDNNLRSALSAKNKDGKPEMKTIWQFEQDLRKDPRWLKTSNAQDSVMGTAKKILGDFGLAV